MPGVTAGYRGGVTTPKASPRLRVITSNLPSIGESILEPDGSPKLGAFQGIPPRFVYSNLTSQFSHNRVKSFLRHKQWMYFFAANDAVIVVAAVADAGPTGTSFAMVTDRATGDVLADASRPGGAGPLVALNDQPTLGHRLHYALPGTLVTARGDDLELHLRATFQHIPYIPLVSKPWIELDIRFATDVHPGLTTVAEIRGESLVTATSKNAALPIRGQVTVHGDGHTQEFDLTGGFGGFDYTNGYLPRSTSWNWAFATGALDDGRTVGINLVSGFSGLNGHADENALWLQGVLHSLDPAAQIVFDADDPLQPWTVTTSDGAVDLQFQPLALHHESLNLGVIRSRFVQPTGHFTGTVRVDGEEIAINRLPGVVEDQDVLW